MKFPLAAAALAFGICLSACGQQEPASPQTRATPSPTPKDELDAGANRLEKKAAGALAAVENYLVGQNPKLREKFIRDKTKWREKLLRKQKNLQPQMDRLQEQLGKLDTSQNRDQLHGELTRLQDLSKDTDKKLAELEAAGQDGWKSFIKRLREEEAKESSPTPVPTGR